MPDPTSARVIPIPTLPTLTSCTLPICILPLIFLTLCYWLHVRDKELMSRREEFETAKA